MQFFALVLLCTGLSFPAFSQDMPLEKSPIVDLDLTLSPGHALPKPNTSSGVTEIPQPLVVKHPKNGNCYALKCASQSGCSECSLLWKDRNGDGKINPRKELRCRCKADPEKECRIRAKRVACKQ